MQNIETRAFETDLEIGKNVNVLDIVTSAEIINGAQSETMGITVAISELIDEMKLPRETVELAYSVFNRKYYFKETSTFIEKVLLRSVLRKLDDTYIVCWGYELE